MYGKGLIDSIASAVDKRTSPRVVIYWTGWLRCREGETRPIETDGCGNGFWIPGFGFGLLTWRYLTSDQFIRRVNEYYRIKQEYSKYRDDQRSVFEQWRSPWSTERLFRELFEYGANDEQRRLLVVQSLCCSMEEWMYYIMTILNAQDVAFLIDPTWWVEDANRMNESILSHEPWDDVKSIRSSEYWYEEGATANGYQRNVP